MKTRYFALVFGVIFLAVGILGFVPGLVHGTHASDPQLAVDANYGYLLGLFPINAVHNLVHIAIGVWGLLAYRSLNWARFYGRGLAVIYGVLTILGLIPQTSTLFGLAPIFGHDTWLHAASALVAAYFGFVLPVQATPSDRDASLGTPLGAH